MFKRKKGNDQNQVPGAVDINKQAYLQILVSRGIDFPDNEAGFVVNIDAVTGRAQLIPEQMKKMFM